MRDMAIRIKKIIYRDKISKYTIMKVTVLKYRPRLKTYQETKEEQTLVGRVMMLYAGDRFSVSAEEFDSKVYGKEYRICSYHREQPGTIDEIKNFLLNFSGLGPGKAKKITDLYGLDTINRILSDEHSMDSLGLATDKVDKIRKDIQDNENFEKILTFLQLNDLDYRYAMPLLKEYGAVALSKMKDEPYVPYLDGVIDFKTADSLSHSMSNLYNDPFRVQTSILACLRSDSENRGNLYMALNQLIKKTYLFLKRMRSGFAQIAFTEEETTAAIQELERKQYVVIDKDPVSGHDNLYLTINYWDELHVAERMKIIFDEPKSFDFKQSEIDRFISGFQNSTSMKLADLQKQAVYMALQKPISVLTGGPGTGKTQTLNTVIAAIKKLAPTAIVKICAPTGKAALRVSQLTNMNASTIHRLLKLGRYNNSLKEDELECDFLLIDEFSMVDCHLCAKLFSAVCPRARIIIVGDFEQLPSVGPGLVLRDMIGSGVIPTTRLTEIFRQAEKSRIIHNAHQIIKQQPEQPILLKISHSPGNDFYFIERETTEGIQKMISRSVESLIAKNGYAMDDIKILSPRKKTDLGTEGLNETLQDKFNPDGEPFECDDGRELRVGDPVIHLKNDYDLMVFNGETGIVKALGYDPDKAMLVEYPDRVVWYNIMQIDELDLAYALTTHKSQGSEFKVAIIPVHETLLGGLSKNLLYTACTRAKEMVILVGTKNAFSLGLRKSTDLDRNTKLAERLQMAI